MVARGGGGAGGAISLEIIAPNPLEIDVVSSDEKKDTVKLPPAELDQCLKVDGHTEPH